MTIQWGTKNIISNGIYLVLSLLFTITLGHLFSNAEGLNTNVKFSYSLLTILGGFASFASLWNLLKAKKGSSDIIIDREKVLIKNRSLGYKEDVEFEITSLKSLTLAKTGASFGDKLMDPLLSMLTGKEYAYHLCVTLKNKEGIIKLFPQASLSVEELKAIADQMQQKIQEAKINS
ncbi:hypothetical protein [Flammeovirga sp. SJP92]|uniref:hypothetical protein n=1 Tax=Flammeovirga sp. SJP92 TaxID=1775430 RepID=UPI000789331C|nr:hypothetical protein [Flammeovirga sp. SJP92]